MLNLTYKESAQIMFNSVVLLISTLSSLTYVYLVWHQKYYLTLAKQLSRRKQKQEIGVNLGPEFLDNFTNEQVVQLNELFSVATKKANGEESWPWLLC